MSTHTKPDKTVKAAPDYKKIIAPYREDLDRVEKSIASNFTSDVAMIPAISSYLIGSGGKRIRPLLVTALHRGCAVIPALQDTLPFLSWQNISTRLLFLHDDVVDAADLRRGAASANVKFGNQASVLVGDFLFATSFKLMSEDSDTRIIDAMSSATRHLAEGRDFAVGQHLQHGKYRKGVYGYDLP